MIWWILASLAAFFIKGLCGFANTLVFTTILSFSSDNINISPVELLLGYPTNVILAYKERKSVDLKICLPLAGLVLLGSLPGIFFLKNADTSLIKGIFGFVIILIGIEMLLRERQTRQREQSKLLLGVIGLLSGILCGLYGIGALLGAYVSRVTKDSHAFKGNICVVFLVEGTFRIIMYAILGIITVDVIKQVLLLLPVMLAGLWLGIKSSTILNEKTVKKIVIVMLIISGVALTLNLR